MLKSKQVLTLRLTNEEEKMIENLKKDLGIKVSSKAIMLACSENKDLKEKNAKLEKELESVLQINNEIKRQCQNVSLAMDFFKNLEIN